MQKMKNVLLKEEEIGRLLDLFLQQLEIINDHNGILLGKSISHNGTVNAITDKHIDETRMTEIRLTMEDNSEIKKNHVFPMSLIQKRLYSYLLLNEEDPYNLVLAIKVKGKIDLQKLTTVLENIIQRHESLRTNFFVQDGELKQEILIDVNFDIKKYQWRETDGINDLISSHITRFDLSDAPLFETLFFEGQTDEGVLVFNFHHTISDGLSINIFMDELIQIYEGHNLPKPPKQYRDYVEWENNYLKSEIFSISEQYWLEKLDDVSTQINLPLDYYNENRKGLAGDSISMTLDAAFTQQLKTIVTECNCSLFMVLLASFQILLSKLTNEGDIAVATTLANRSEWDFENVMGMFVNTSVLRNQIDDKMQLADFFEQVKTTCLQAYQHMSYPYNLLLNKLGIKGEDGFNVMFVYEKANRSSSDLGGIKLESYDYKPDIQEFELTLEILEDESELHLYLRYQIGLFKQETIQILLDRYRQVIEQVAFDVNKTIGEIEFVDEIEKNKILFEFNDTAIDFPYDKTIVELFETQVRNKPHQVALVFNNETMTYGELNGHVNALAKVLRRSGIERETCVVVSAVPGLEMIIGILGILKSGGAYVPIDPQCPQERVDYIISDCKPKMAVIYQADIAMGIPTLELEEYRYLSEKENLSVVNKPNDLAYLIYTSGTTGNPKGVMVEHIGVANLNTYYFHAYQIKEDDVILLFANLAFDASVGDMMMGLLNGVALVLLASELKEDVRQFEDYCDQKGVTIATLPPQFCAQLSRFTQRIIITAGSEVSKQVVRSIPPEVKYINVYGPTENTVCATQWEYNRNDEIPDRIPIGRAISNTQVYVLNGVKLCGIGMVGELCIAGSSVARGYLNREELTNEKFIGNPFGEGKLYRTGDLARWRSDGNLEYLGRMDDQVKIRGFRIELGEIEVSIKNIPQITGAAVLVREGKESGDKMICAYYVADQIIDQTEVKEALRITLPAYMIPTFMMQLEQMPVTRNGKIDKKALPEIKVEKYTKEYSAPKNEIERHLAQIFEDVLGVDRAGIKDSFFELGGDSIKAIRIISKMRDAGYELNMRSLMQEKDLEAIATRVVKYKEGIQYEQGEVTGSIINTPIMKMFFGMQLPKPGYFNLAMMIKKEGGFDEAVVRKTLAALAVHHDVIRAVCRENMLEIVGSKGSELYELKVFDIKEEENVEKRIDKICTDIQSGMDLVRSPLLRAGLFKTAERDHLMLCLHHLVVDDVSRRILLEDFKTVYQQIELGKKVSLSVKTASFKEWSVALAEYAESPVLQKEKAYWSKINESALKHNLICEYSHEEKGTGSISFEFDKD